MGLKIRNAVTLKKMRILKNKDHIRNLRGQVDLKSCITLIFVTSFFSLKKSGKGLPCYIDSYSPLIGSRNKTASTIDFKQGSNERAQKIQHFTCH
jgi:hypothetical protein